MNKTLTMPNTKRTDKHEPTPEEVLEYIAEVVDESNQWGEYPFNKCSLTLGVIREGVAKIMASKGEYFTSEYRHANGGLHESVYRILGGTVSLNDMIAKDRT